MALNKVNYVDNQTIITAQNLNDIQDEIIENAELIKKVTPRNLLDNSDFTNPVNQRGQTTYTGTSLAYNIDRWLVNRAAAILTVNNSDSLTKGITLDNTAATENSYFGQRLVLENGVYTGGAKTTDGILLVTATVVGNNIYFKSTETGENAAINLVVSGDYILFQIIALAGKSISVDYAFLYEGNYTKETLPEYQSKGYGAELAECQRYYQEYGAGLTFVRENNHLWITFPFVNKMRSAPESVTLLKTNIPLFSHGAGMNANLYLNDCTLTVASSSANGISAIVIDGTESTTFNAGMYRYNGNDSLLSFSADLL